MKHAVSVATVVAALCTLTPAAFAADSLAAPPAATSVVDSLSARRVQAARASQTINIDGVLDEPVWLSAAVSTDLRQSDDREGQPASQPTEVRVAYDDDAIYVGARMHDAHADSIIARLVRRDDWTPSDRFVLFLDPFRDKRSGYFFAVNAAGVLGDGVLFNDGWDDTSWDAVWQAKVRRDPQGWTAEMRVPLSQLRYRRDGGPWGVNFRRELTRSSERDWLAYPPRTQSGFCSRFPEMHGIQEVQAGRSMEITPYVTGQAEYLAHDDADPFIDGSKYTPSVGADLRMSVGGSLTLNATANPDFGQVEVDPAVVNLSDIESFFPEKRPFFVENSRVFSFGNEGANDYWSFNWPEPMFFYTRRIGRTPQFDLSGTWYNDVPLATSIAGAGKLTGKLMPGLNFGTLHAVTSSETGRLDYGGGTRFDQEVEPLTYYGVLRGQREFKERRQGLGLMTTMVQRDLGDASLEGQLNRTSLMSGLDGWVFLDRKKVWVVSGYTAMSHVRGTQPRIQSLQTNSRHYFQRPDQNYLPYDPDATSLSGWVSRLWLNKQEGKHFIFNSALGAISPGFDTNDIGFQTRTDVINGHVGMGWGWNDPNKWRKWANWLVAGFGSRDFGGATNWAGVWSKVNVEAMNNYSYNLGLAWNPATLSDTRTRGGPRMRVPGGWETNLHFDSDSKSKLFWFLDSYSYVRPQSDSWVYSIEPGIELKPMSNLLFRVGPAYERNVEDAQYVWTEASSAATGTYGNRYLFGRLDQKTVSANLRLNVSFTPNLSLQTFLQPLISAGNYTDLKELARGRSYEFNRYGADSVVVVGDYTWEVRPSDGGAAFLIDNPNFNTKSIRGNAVLRWEYSPGSTLFFVWTQERSFYEPRGSFEFNRDFDRIVDTKPSNVFLVKATYYLSR